MSKCCKKKTRKGIKEGGSVKSNFLMKFRLLCLCVCMCNGPFSVSVFAVGNSTSQVVS